MKDVEAKAIPYSSSVGTGIALISKRSGESVGQLAMLSFQPAGRAEMERIAETIVRALNECDARLF